MRLFNDSNHEKLEITISELNNKKQIDEVWLKISKNRFFRNVVKQFIPIILLKETVAKLVNIFIVKIVQNSYLKKAINQGGTMYKSQRIQLSFYDTIYDKLISKDHFLRKLNSLIQWDKLEPVFKPLYHKGAGRSANNPVMMFKSLMLQFLYDLSDRELEDNIHDRVSFRYFIGLDPLESAPDHTNYCRFRDRLGAVTIAKLFNEVVNQARERGLVKDRLCIVDATHVQAKVNTYRMNSDTSKRETDDNGSPPSRIDPDARHGYKSKNKPFFGYKVGIGVDKNTNIITMVTSTPGNEHDSTHFSDVADPHAKAVTADKGYDSPANFKLIRERKQKAAILVKKRKGKQRGHIKARYPAVKEYQYYYRMKKFRPLIEKIFATAKQWYGLRRARYWGLAKMKIQAVMTMMAINLKRMVLLDTCVYK